MIIKKAQFNYYDIFDDSQPGWENHTRVQVKKRPGEPVKVFYHSGKHLPRIKYVEISKSL